MKQTPQTKSTLISSCLSLSVLLLAGALNQANAATAPPDGKAPLLANSLEQLQPQAVWRNFYQITQVPRPSHHEEKISAFVAAFGPQIYNPVCGFDYVKVVLYHKHGVAFVA